MEYSVNIFNIASIQKPVKLKEMTVQASMKAEAMEKAHQKARAEYPNFKIVVSVQEIGRYV